MVGCIWEVGVGVYGRWGVGGCIWEVGGGRVYMLDGEWLGHIYGRCVFDFL